VVLRAAPGRSSRDGGEGCAFASGYRGRPFPGLPPPSQMRADAEQIAARILRVCLLRDKPNLDQLPNSGGHIRRRDAELLGKRLLADTNEVCEPHFRDQRVNRLATLTPDWSAPLGRRVLAVASAPSGVALTAPGPQAPNQAGVCPPKTQAAGPQKKEVSVRPALSEPRGHGPRQ